MSQLAERVLNHPVTETLGWVLLHFLWQGAGIAICLYFVLAMLRRASANARYLAACAALLGAVLLPVVTFCLLPGQEPISSMAIADVASIPAVGSPSVNTKEINPVAVIEDEGSIGPESFLETPPFKADDLLTSRAAAEHSQGRLDRLGKLLRPGVPVLTCVWLAGVVILSCRLLASWLQVQRLQYRNVQPARDEFRQLLGRLANRLGIERSIELLESAIVEVPTVIGWLRPVILLPVASINSLTVQELEAILAHELAHIRRADYAVNLVQSLIETLLFYHPAVWWISSRIRQEREHCCDDLATSISGDTAAYAAALVRMEELRCEPRSVAVAARGGDLLSRVRRLLVPSTPDRLAPRWLTGVFAMAIAAMIVCVPLLKTSQAEPATVETSTKPSDEKSSAVEEAKNQPATNEKATPLADINLDEITPAQIADRIEESRKRYASAEYTAMIEQTRNTSAFKPDAKPTLVTGTDTLLYRCDGELWYRDHKSFSYNIGSTQTYPIHTLSSFDGAMHRVLENNVLKLAEEDAGAHQFAPAELFWKGGISSDWVLGALRRPEAKLVERLQMAETSCLHVTVEWKPEWSETTRSFDLMICPEQSWLVRRATIMDGDELMADWSIDVVAQKESGLHYPAEFKVNRPEMDSTPSTRFTISKFQDRTNFEPHEFQVPNPIGIDIVDYRSGFAWHNDPWWNELGAWARENLDWPQPDQRPLTTLQSYSPPELAGTVAPELMPGEWLNQPGKLSWDRPERCVTVLYFFGGRLIEPTPEQIAALSHLQRKYADGGLEIIGITSHSKTQELTRQAIRELVPSFPIMIDVKANETDISKDVVGADWGANFVQYQLRPYTGTVVVNKAGKVVLIDPAGTNLISGKSQLEALIREELIKSNVTADGPSLRRAQVNRTSCLLRGAAAGPDEFAAADNDQSPLWLQNAQQAIVSRIPDEQQEFLKSHGLTVQATLQELASSSTRIPDAAWYRLEEEWKKRAAAASRNGVISGRIRKYDGEQWIAAKGSLEITPIFELLSSNTTGSTTIAVDRSRIRRIDTDESGAYAIDKLAKGSYRISFVVPGKPLTTKSVSLMSHESQVELNVDLAGSDYISGKVTDAAGNPVHKALVKAVKRYATQKALDAGQHTTEFLPSEALTTSLNGQFSFESLHDGAYQFEVSAEGFETTTTEPVPAGTPLLRVILKPVLPDQAAAAARAILGTVIHQGQPVANARVGLQAWIGDSGPYRNSEAFVATALTGNDGQYVLTVPNTADSKSSVAIWAVAEGFQPTRENIVMNVSEASETLQNITLAKSPGCVLQISDANGTPMPNVAVTVPSQTLPESIDFEIPKDWRSLISGKTDAEGIVSLPYVVPEAMTEVQIQVPGQDSLVVATGNYFLNAKPAAKTPHHHFKLPRSGALEGKIEMKAGQLPPDLTLEISTESSMTDEPRRLQTLGVARAQVDADGRFRIESIAVGSVTIKPFLPVNQPLRAELPQNIQVVAGKTTSFAINGVQGVLLRGRIVASDTGNGLAGVRFQILYGTSAREPQNMHNSIDVVTDDQGHYQVWVPSGRVLLRIGWRDQKYSQVEYWRPRSSGLGSAFEVPDAEEFELEPITFVPSKELSGQLVDQDGQPLVNWRVFGYPEIPGKSTEYVTNCFGGTTSDGDGRFSSLYPSTFPPAVWRVSHQDWPSPYESNDRKWIAKVISQEPLILQVDTNPAPPAPSIDVVKSVLLRGRIVASDTGKGLAGKHFQILYGSALHIIPWSSGNRISSRDRIYITTDNEGFYKAKVPSGLVVLHIDSQDEHYSQVEDWSPRATQKGSAFKVPDVEEFELEPIKFVPSKVMDGQLVDQDGQPLADWTVYGYPDVPPRPPIGYVRSCFGGTTSNREGKFSGLYPSTFSPVVWKVSHRGDRRNKYQAKVISQEPLILQVDTNPAPPAPLRNASNSGDMADDEAIASSGLQGKWSLQFIKWNGINVPEEQCRQTTMTIEGHQLTIDKYWNISFTNIDPVTRVAEGGFTADTGLAGAIHLNSSQTPYEVDLTINGVGTAEQEEELGEDERAAIRSGKLKVYGLCTVNGDELKLCLSDARMDAPPARPTEFSAGESSERTLFVFKRIQP